MIWLLGRLVVWPLKLVVGTGAVATQATAKAAAGSARVGYRAGRLVGYHRLAILLVGVVIGLLLAPGPGRDMRARLRDRVRPDDEPSRPDDEPSRPDEPSAIDLRSTDPGTGAGPPAS